MADQKVFVSDGELRQFELAGISREMLHQDIKRGLADGLPPQEIELRIAAKAERLEKANPSIKGESFGGVIPENQFLRSLKRGTTGFFGHVPFGDTINRGFQAIGAAYDATMDKLTGNDKPTLRQYLETPEGYTPVDRSWGDLYNQYYDEGIKRAERTVKEMDYDFPKSVQYLLKGGTTIGSYGLLPSMGVGKEMLLYGADAYQSGLNKKTGDRALNAGVGAGLAGMFGVGGKLLTKANELRKAAPTDTIKKEVSMTLGKTLERPQYTIDVAKNKAGQEVLTGTVTAPHQKSIIGQMLNSHDAGKGLEYAEQEALVRKLPKIVKANKETGVQIVNDARKNVNKSYLETVVDNLKSEADLIQNSNPELSKKMFQIADELKNKKTINNFDDLFTKGVSEADDLANVEGKQILDLLDDYVNKIKSAKSLTETEKKQIVKNIFDSGMERRASKRVAFIDETDMAKKVGGSWVGDRLKAGAKDLGSGAIGLGIDLMLGGTGAVGGILGALGREGIGLMRGQSSALIKKRAQQRGIQNALDIIKSRQKSTDVVKDIVHSGSPIEQSKKLLDAMQKKEIVGEVTPAAKQWAAEHMSNATPEARKILKVISKSGEPSTASKMIDSGINVIDVLRKPAVPYYTPNTKSDIQNFFK